MNEKSFEYPIRKKLQQLLPEAIVIKHYDAGMIGMWDCSVISHGNIYALEFKFWRVPLRVEEDEEFRRWINKEAEKKFKGPQHKLLLQAAKAAAGAWYVVGLSTGGVVILTPESFQTHWTTRELLPGVLVELMAGNLRLV